MVDYGDFNTSFGGRYWIARNTHTSSPPPSSGTTSNTNWQSFGATFTSVATDILFAQDVYADRTINIGPFGAGTNSVIALNADSPSNQNPFIGIRKTSYTNDATAGVFMGFDQGIPKLNIGSATSFLKWTGSSVEMNGTITATSGILGG